MGSKNKNVLISWDHFPILGELYSAVCTMCQMFALKMRTDILGRTLDHDTGFLDIKGNNTYSTKFSGQFYCIGKRLGSFNPVSFVLSVRAQLTKATRFK